MHFNWDQMRCVNRQMNLTNEVHVGLCLLPTFVNPRLGEPQTQIQNHQTLKKVLCCLPVAHIMGTAEMSL